MFTRKAENLCFNVSNNLFCVCVTCQTPNVSWSWIQVCICIHRLVTSWVKQEYRSCQISLIASLNLFCYCPHYILSLLVCKDAKWRLVGRLFFKRSGLSACSIECQHALEWKVLCKFSPWMEKSYFQRYKTKGFLFLRTHLGHALVLTLSANHRLKFIMWEYLWALVSWFHNICKKLKLKHKILFTLHLAAWFSRLPGIKSQTNIILGGHSQLLKSCFLRFRINGC